MPLLDFNNKEDVKRLEEFISNSPYGKTTQSLAWRQIKNNWQPFYIYLEDENGNIKSSMLILTIDNPVGKKLAYAPKGPVCDTKNPQNVKELFDGAEKYLNTDEIFMLRCDPEILYSEELNKDYQNLGFITRNKDVDPHSTIQPRLNMILDLQNKTEDEAMQALHKKTRYNIRLAQRKGVKCTYSTSDKAIDLFYDTHKIMAERQQISYRPKDYFKRLIKEFGPNHARVYLTFDDEEVLSGAIAINYGDRVWYMYGGSTNNKRNLMPNYLMQWEMIKWALETNKPYYDFGGIFKIDLEDGLYRFKKSFTGGVTEYIGEIDRVYDQEKYNQFNS